MPLYGYVMIAVGSVLWALAFPLARSKYKGSLRLDRRARWGVALQAIGYTMLWQGSFWTRSLPPWRMGTSILLFGIACALSWTSAGSLGKQLRVDAALIANHRLIRSGPYGVVRHPIYASMLAVVAGTGLVIAPWYLLLTAIAVFLAGTEVRIRTEDALLESHFGEEFRQYRRAVKGLIPFVA
ncbi:MAG: isoprenylcysteine carboxylmethyltransferase family protein [Acidobacteriaceae bacterium]|nr:isoprenylcysteine carboxylmethyltransferase family protein [Acidobacteriaceae bacterium]